MNPGRRTDDAHGLARRYRSRACRQFGASAGGDPGVIVDAGMGIAGAGLIAVAAWGSPRLIGSEAIAGPSWLLALLPLLLGAPLVLRRRAPLLMWLAIWAGIALLSLLADNSLQGLAFTFVLFAAAYSLGAHASLRRAVAGLVLTAPVVVVISHRAAGAGLRAGTAARGRGLVVAAAAGLLAGWRARPRPQAGRFAGRAKRGAAAPGRAGHGGRAGPDRPGTARHRRPSPQRDRAAGGRRPGVGKAGRGDPGEDREQRTAGAGRDPPPAGRPARPGRGDRARPAAGHRRPGRAGRQRPGGRRCR